MGLLSKAILKARFEDRAETPLTRDGIEAGVVAYHASHTVFQAIVFELPLYHDAAYDTRKRLASMVSSLGIVIPLNSAPVARDLALFPRKIDCELVIHRLVKSLGVVSPRSFEANSPEHALALLEPFIT
ncbi:MAG: hypothetical protein LBD79_08715 [Treponema sp.]|jgi:hypothetical protein|nr:hypothetical protein [Treponema sp.]